MAQEHDYKDEHIEECFCKCKWFKKFLLKFISVYLGVLLALCTFFAIHKPKMPPCMHHKAIYKYNDKNVSQEEFNNMRKNAEKMHKEYFKEFDRIQQEQMREIDKIRKSIESEFDKRD